MTQLKPDELTLYIASVVQGRYDITCAPKTAWDLHQAWPESRLYMISASGHSVKVNGSSLELRILC